MKKLIPIIAILLTLTLLVGCAGGAKGAQKVADKFLTAIVEEDYETAADCLHPGFLESIAYDADVEPDDFAEDYYKQSAKDYKYELSEYEIVDVDLECDETVLERATVSSKYLLDGKTVKGIAYVRFERKEERNGDKVKYEEGEEIATLTLYQIGSKWYVAEPFLDGPKDDDQPTISVEDYYE